MHGHLFIPGPTNVPEPVRQAVNHPMEDMRSADFPKLTLPLFEDFKKDFKTTAGQVFIFPASGTGGWEAAISDTLSPGDKVVVSNFGQFSHLWADLCRRHNLDVDEIEVEWGEGAPPEEGPCRLAADTAHEIKGVIVCHHETATGVTSDVAAVRRALDEANHPPCSTSTVSARSPASISASTSGVSTLPYRTPRKVSCCRPGSLVVGVSQMALEARAGENLPRCFFDFDDMIQTNKDGYFPYTPAATLLRGLRASLDILFEEGLGSVFAHRHRIGGHIHRFPPQAAHKCKNPIAAAKGRSFEGRAAGRRHNRRNPASRRRHRG